jgi:N-acetyl-gamma-glutamyl-phosphate reductase / acetylglutamate kinase
MAMPNHACQPFVEALNQGSSVIVDLSADYRFDSTGEWTYALPELVKRSKIAVSTRISNPGCYATGAQLGIAPLLPYLGGVPTVFGVSGVCRRSPMPALTPEANWSEVLRSWHQKEP